MGWVPLTAFGISTLGVAALALIPGAGDELLIVFPKDVGERQIRGYLEERDLPLIDYIPEYGHVVTRDESGEARAYLYDKGAKLVVKASYGAACRDLRKQAELGSKG